MRPASNNMKSKGGKWRFWPSKYLIFLTNKKTGGRRLHFISGEFREGLVVLGHAKHMIKGDKRKKLSIFHLKREKMKTFCLVRHIRTCLD